LLLGLLNWQAIVRRLADPVIACFAAFTLLAVASSTYSLVPAVTLVSAISVAAYLGYACLITEELTERQIIVPLVWGFGAYCVINWLTALIWPDIGELPFAPQFRLQGIAGHPNLLGRQVAIFLCLAVGAYSRGYLGRSFWPLLGLGLATLAGTQSRTAILGFVGSFLLLNRKRAAILVLIALLGLAAVLLSGIDLSWWFDGTLERSGDPDALAGRDVIWAYVWTKVEHAPLFGYGFNSFLATAFDGAHRN
jgi:O-antigen ligase